jgi:Tfp pilus assembly protein PilX
VFVKEYDVKLKRKQKGMAALMFTMTILAVVTVITLFTAQVIVTDNRILNNVETNEDALNAAQAGLDYGVGYLNAYPYVVANGLAYCAAATNTFALTAQTMANGSTYTATYSCVAAGNIANIKLVSVGTAVGAAATRTVQASLEQYCGGPPVALTTTGTATLSNTSVVSNTTAGATRTIDSGGATTINNTATSNTTTGGAYSCATGGVQPATCRNVRETGAANGNPPTTALTTITSANRQLLYLGRLISAFSALATVYNIDCSPGGANTFTETTTFGASGCTNSGSGGTGVTLPTAGASGGLIYMSMATDNLILTTASGATFTLGAAATPVVLVIVSTGGATVAITTNAGANSTMVINGNVYFSSGGGAMSITTGSTLASRTTTINGFVFSTNAVNLANNGVVNGAVISSSTALTQAARINYTPANITRTFNNYCGGAWGIVPGSWRDF